MKYTPPLGSDNADAPFVDADPANGKEGSIIPAAALENPQREIVAAIQDAGLSPNASDKTQLKQAINKKVQAMVSQCQEAVNNFIASDSVQAAGTATDKVPNVKQIDQKQAAILIADRLYQGQNLATKFASEISSYANVWAWMQARIRAGNFAGIHVGDYIPFTTTSGTVGTDTVSAATYNAQIAGIDTYYGYGDTAVGHHIDFITKECVPTEVKWNPVDNNNGTSVEEHPWKASLVYAWLNGVNNYSTSAFGSAAHGINAAGKGMLQRLPTDLQNVLVEKRMLMEKRYSSSGLLTASNGWDWLDAGKLWLPTENEVYGCQVWSASFPGESVQAWASSGAVQYPLFATTGGKICNRIKPIAGSSGSRTAWWLSVVHGGLSTFACLVYGRGEASGSLTAYAGVRVPLCFRIA